MDIDDIERIGEHRLIKERERAHLAQQITSNPIWQEAWSRYEDEMIRAWRQAPARDTEGREALWLSLKAAERVRGHIESVITTGKLAEKQLEDAHARANPGR